MTQREFALHLRAAIDSARKYPTRLLRDQAIELARSQPQALRSQHVLHNLGQARLEWLATQGVYLVDGPVVPDITT